MKRYVNLGFSCATVALMGLTAAGVAAQSPAAMAQASGTTTMLGLVRIPRAVKADGKPLSAGSYQLRVTESVAEPAAPGQTPQSERWAEFLQGGQVKGREVVTIVSQGDIAEVGKVRPPASGSYRVELLKGNDYLRLWYHKGANHYLVHFNVG
jgi:hypothetical protein